MTLLSRDLERLPWARGGAVVDRQAIRIGALLWAMVGLAVALPSVAMVNPDARVLVGIASVAFPACAGLSAVAVAKSRLRTSGFLLLLSAATPTFFAFALNLAALVVGMALLVVPGLTVRRFAAEDCGAPAGVRA